MFKDKILAQLVAKYPGVSKKFLGLWAEKLQAKVTEETQIEGVINELDNLPVSIPDLATEFQKEGDTRVTEAEKTWKKKNPPAKPDPGKTEDPKEDEIPDDTPAWAKGLIQSQKVMSEKLQNLEKEKSQTSIRSKVEGHEKLKAIPKSFYDEWALPEKEEDIEAFADKVVTKHTAFKQEGINETASKTTKPVSGNKTPAKVDDKEVKAIVDKIV